MRLIDADDLKKTWYKEHNIEPGESGAMFVGNNEVPKFIDRARTIDAVPVVRCKDCRWRNTIGCDAYVAAQSVYACEDDGFCKWAERKKDE